MSRRISVVLLTFVFTLFISSYVYAEEIPVISSGTGISATEKALGDSDFLTIIGAKSLTSSQTTTPIQNPQVNVETSTVQVEPSAVVPVSVEDRSSATDRLETAAPAPEVSRGSSTARLIISTAHKYLGIPYCYGGRSTKGFDCSGFVGYVFEQCDIKLLRSSRDQATQGVHVDKKDLIPADLVFFKTGGSSRINHVGIYIGDSRFIHSSTSKGITVTSLNEKYYLNSYYGARRILQ
jgi:cell wall-associated NlpC family hydrolase